MKKRFPHLIRVTVMGEDLPEEHNRVELDGELKDTSGIPAPRVVYSYGENSLKMLEHGRAMARQSLEAAGAIEILDSGAAEFSTEFEGVFALQPGQVIEDLVSLAGAAAGNAESDGAEVLDVG